MGKDREPKPCYTVSVVSSGRWVSLLGATCAHPVTGREQMCSHAGHTVKDSACTSAVGRGLISVLWRRVCMVPCVVLVGSQDCPVFTLPSRVLFHFWVH